MILTECYLMQCSNTDETPVIIARIRNPYTSVNSWQYSIGGVQSQYFNSWRFPTQCKVAQELAELTPFPEKREVLAAMVDGQTKVF